MIGMLAVLQGNVLITAVMSAGAVMTALGALVIQFGGRR